ncbi:NAD(P)/FAD-dependent oxidoreductase [Candidatus Woesearchaeota archaeon]|nr:NAD(P)/FAD-dependent oxidoreductase [Candidatus Woesearchaeota archaeon]
MISVIGGGPAGLFCAYNLAKKGIRSTVFEEHKRIGEPVQCTGIVTRAIDALIRVPGSVIVNRINRVRAHVLGNGMARDTVELRVDDIVLDRAGFDRHIADLALSEGVSIVKNTRVNGILRKNNRLAVIAKDKPYLSSAVIGADGPMSMTRMHIDKRKLSFLASKQAIVKGRFDDDCYDVFFSDDFPGFFGWLVPESRRVARIGLACKGNPNMGFDALFKQLRLTKASIAAMQGGLIPVYDPYLRTQKDNIYILGDAAAQLKATTGGGIVPGLAAAETLSLSIASGRMDYQSAWKKRIGKELWLHLFLRKALDRFSQKDYNKLFTMLSQGRMDGIFSRYDRDNPYKLIFALVLKEPGLLRYALKAI